MRPERARVQANILEHPQIVAQHGKSQKPTPLVRREIVAIALQLSLQRLTSFPKLVVLVNPLDHLFETDGDQQADDDGRDMDEEIAPAMDCGVGCVNFEHKGPIRKSWQFLSTI